MGHPELVLWHTVVHLEQPSSGPSLHGVEALAADNLSPNLQNGLGVPVQDGQQWRIPGDLGPERRSRHTQERPRRLANHLHRKGDTTQIDS
jgi:hypothetical protein